MICVVRFIISSNSLRMSKISCSFVLSISTLLFFTQFASFLHLWLVSYLLIPSLFLTFVQIIAITCTVIIDFKNLGCHVIFKLFNSSRYSSVLRVASSACFRTPILILLFYFLNVHRLTRDPVSSHYIVCQNVCSLIYCYSLIICLSYNLYLICDRLTFYKNYHYIPLTYYGFLSIFIQSFIILLFFI